MASAVHYVKIAERTSGPITRVVDYAYVWGECLDARIIYFIPVPGILMKYILYPYMV